MDVWYVKLVVDFVERKTKQTQTKRNKRKRTGKTETNAKRKT